MLLCRPLVRATRPIKSGCMWYLTSLQQALGSHAFCGLLGASSPRIPRLCADDVPLLRSIIRVSSSGSTGHGGCSGASPASLHPHYLTPRDQIVSTGAAGQLHIRDNGRRGSQHILEVQTRRGPSKRPLANSCRRPSRCNESVPAMLEWKLGPRNALTLVQSRERPQDLRYSQHATMASCLLEATGLRRHVRSPLRGIQHGSHVLAAPCLSPQGSTTWHRMSTTAAGDPAVTTSIASPVLTLEHTHANGC
jgi:hypothetical protein